MITFYNALGFSATVIAVIYKQKYNISTKNI